MKKFKKLVVIEPVNMDPWAVEKLHEYAEYIKIYDDIPDGEDEIIKRIGDADAVLLSYTSVITERVLKECTNIEYIGMCCSLYSEDSANVDIRYAREHGITVKGIRDYGDRGVAEYAVCELVRFLRGYERPMLYDIPEEFTDIKMGIVGLGVSGRMIADTLQFFGARVSYYSRTRKPDAEEKGIGYMPLQKLLSENDIIFTCLNKNVLLLGKEEFEHMEHCKLLFNTSIGPGFDTVSLKTWLDHGKHYFACDTEGAMGDLGKELIRHPHVFCVKASAGRTGKAFELLSRKVLDNIMDYCC